MRLQQGFTTGGMGSDRHFAWQQSLGPNVRFGSKADIGGPPIDVRFTPKSGHRNSVTECPLCAKSGLMQCSKKRLVDHLIKRQRAGTPLNLNRCYIPNV
jgi:hypothetical protein